MGRLAILERVFNIFGVSHVFKIVHVIVAAIAVLMMTTFFSTVAGVHKNARPTKRCV